MSPILPAPEEFFPPISSDRRFRLQHKVSILTLSNVIFFLDIFSICFVSASLHKTPPSNTPLSLFPSFSVVFLPSRHRPFSPSRCGFSSSGSSDTSIIEFTLTPRKSFFPPPRCRRAHFPHPSLWFLRRTRARGLMTKTEFVFNFVKSHSNYFRFSSLVKPLLAGLAL